MRVQSQFIEMFGNSIHTKKLIEVCNIEKGSTITKEQTSNGDIPVVAGGLEPSCYHNVANRPAGMITVSASGANAGYVNYWEVPIFASDCNTIYPIELEKVSPIFMYWQLKVIQKQIYKLQKGGAQPHVYGKDLADMQIVQPPMEFQLRYIKIAEQADKSKFVSFKSQFIEMFGGCANRIKLSSLCSTFVDGDWIESKDQSELGIRLIQTGNVGNGFFKDKEDKSRYISEETFDNLHCTEIYPGDILVSRLPDPIGRACIIPQGLGRTITAVDCTIICLKDIILPDYFIAYTMTPSYAAQINEVTTGTTRRRVSRANLGNILIPCPSIAKQQQFVAIVNQADKSKYYN